MFRLLCILNKNRFSIRPKMRKNQKCTKKTKNQDTQTDSDQNQKFFKNTRSNRSNGNHNPLYNEMKQKLK